jgi:hypothetical protein
VKFEIELGFKMTEAISWFWLNSSALTARTIKRAILWKQLNMELKTLFMSSSFGDQFGFLQYF